MFNVGNRCTFPPLLLDRSGCRSSMLNLAYLGQLHGDFAEHTCGILNVMAFAGRFTQLSKCRGVV
jgi:hypothetical protein